jgi:8-oxo-dGTP diphosphatase
MTLDLVLLAFHGDRLQVLVGSEPDGGGRARRELPWVPYDGSESLDVVVRQAAREALGAVPGWLEQAGAFDARKRHPGEGGISIAFVGLMGDGSDIAAQYTWADLETLGSIPARQKAMLESALEMLRNRLDFEPLAFRLLPGAFTLTALQQIYEQLLGQPLHKASFRRALQAAELVQPLNEFRTEGRGRPAQLFRYAPRLRKPPARSARFDLLERV